MSIGIFETPEEQQEFVSRIGNLRSKFAMLDAERQAALGDPSRLNALLQEQRRVKVETEEELKRKQLDNFAKQNPQFAEMYKIFGEKGLQTAYLDSVAAQRQEQEKKQLEQTYIDAGMNPQLASLIASGVDPEIAQDLLGGDTDQDIIDNIDKQVEATEEMTNFADQFANLSEAFGTADAIQEGINVAARGLGFNDPAPETGAAARARDSLNLEILANLAADFTGRPNMLIYEEIRNILPTKTLDSEFAAFERYKNVLNLTEGRINDLESGIKSNLTSDSNKTKYAEELAKTKRLKLKLEAAIASLNPERKQVKKDFFDPKEISGTGQFKDFYRQ
jgi:hypothetical protein